MHARVRSLVLLALLGATAASPRAAAPPAAAPAAPPATTAPKAVAPQPAAVPIVVAPGAHPAERLAAEELGRDLGTLHPGERFPVVETLPDSGRCIVLGGVDRDGPARAMLAKDPPTAREGYAVRSVADGPRQALVIGGADARGAVYGSCALLERLGCAFTLSGDALSKPRAEPFTVTGWALAEQPLAATRLVFDWHNFLSGCSSWDVAQWKGWIRQAQRGRFNAVMVHAYGNNPMVSFEFAGKRKPVGYLSTTVRGRDWSTQHVNDVRRLRGGEVFERAVFGAEAGLGPEEGRVAATRALMREAFAAAEQRAMDVWVAVDVDTVSANPQDLILSLPESARFAVRSVKDKFFASGDGAVWLADPDSEEGRKYYRAQAEALLSDYPQIDTVALWFRHNPTPWTAMLPEEMPARWRDEFQAAAARVPGSEALPRAHNLFAIGKIARAWRAALDAIGHPKVGLAAGSWYFDFLPSAHRFLPENVALVALDYAVLHGESQLRDAASLRFIRDVAEHRPVLPVVWAHHDDGCYIGRPFTPFDRFQSRLAEARACGFGILHWTTRPLDLYFWSLSRQVWSGTRDETPAGACAELGARLFGTGAPGVAGGEYLQRWITGAPVFGRETSDWFIDRPLEPADAVAAGTRERLAILDRIAKDGLSPDARARLAHMRGMEEFAAEFHRAQEGFDLARAALLAGDIAGARRHATATRPEQVIALYARVASEGGITRGEQGIVVSLNLRWLTHFVRLRQALGLEPVRVRFAPTSHDPLAQSAGRHTYHTEPGGTLWECRGQQETGIAPQLLPASTTVTLPPPLPADWAEICRSAIESTRPVTIPLHPDLAFPGSKGVKSAAVRSLPQGAYRLRLLHVDPTSKAPGERVFSVEVKAAGAPRPTARAVVDIFAETREPGRVLEKVLEFRLDKPAAVELTLAPERGAATLCAAVLEPVGVTKP